MPKHRKRPKSWHRRAEGKAFRRADAVLPRIPVDDPLPPGEPRPLQSNGSGQAKKKRGKRRRAR